MSKVVAALVATGGASVATVGGAYLIQKRSEADTGGDSAKDQSRTSITPNQTQTTLSASTTPAPISADLSEFVSLDKFKEKKGGDCGKHFTSLNLSGTGGTQVDSDTNKIDANYFNGSDDAKSCLVVNWERTDSTPTPNKWKGYFRWVWSFVKGDKGFIAFTTTKLSDAEKQLDLEGGIYFLNKSGDSWSVDKYKTLTDKKIDSTTFSTALSKPGESLADLTDKNSWGFMSAASDLDNVCKKDEESNCANSGDTKKIFKESWIWAKDNANASSGTMIKWCKDFENYFKSMYETNEIDLKGNLEALSGAWKKEVLEEPSATA